MTDPTPYSRVRSGEQSGGFTWTGSDPATRRGGYRETVVRKHRRERHASLMLRATRKTARWLGPKRVAFLLVAAFTAFCLLVASFGCAAAIEIDPAPQGHTTPRPELTTPSPMVAPAPVVLPEKSNVWTVLDEVLDLLASVRRGDTTIRDAITWVQDRRRKESPAAGRPAVAGGEGISGDSTDPPAQQSAAVRGVQVRSDDAFEVLPGGD